MRRLPYVGTWLGELDVPLAATCGNVIVCDDLRLTDPAFAARILAFAHLRLVPLMAVPIDALAGDAAATAAWVERIRNVRAAAQANGLLDRVVATMLNGEYYTQLKAGAWNHHPAVQQLPPAWSDKADLLCRQLEAFLLVLKQAWPGHYAGIYETHWSNRKEVGDLYHPTPATADYLAIDAYIAPGAPPGRAGFDVGPRRAIEEGFTIGKPILLIGHAFTQPDWSHMPTVEQMRCYAEAAAHPLVLGLVWFTLQWDPSITGTPGFSALRDYPDRLAFVQWHAQYCGVTNT